MLVEIDQREGCQQPLVVLLQAAIAHPGGVKDALQDAEDPLHFGAHPRSWVTSLPAFCALIQFDNVRSTTPSDRAASAMLRPDSTRRTASCLNSYV